MLSTLALMAFAMATAALVFTIAMATTLALVLLSMLLTIALAIVAVAAATTAAGAAHLLSHGLGNLLIRGSSTLLDSNAEILIHNGKHIIQLLTSLQEALADRVIHHILAQAVEGGDFLLGRRHTLHVLVAKLLAIFIDLAEKVGGFGVLVEETDAGLGRNYLLALCKCSGQLSCQFHQFRCE